MNISLLPRIIVFYVGSVPECALQVLYVHAFVPPIMLFYNCLIQPWKDNALEMRTLNDV
ncbi:uncharacterized protein BDZ99DRAFT_463520 [Mytilinidion resinicola]|uniref:Uncharacterized protein n=1 Tax=Mytilinidion resinicola TaxID=574789 RepID=A0A6A6YPG6_9PEZI|nr:uncharacterized protein BDZ99DRAFT_463520 [Mytilinidion resinicola]KAF2809757.1 hypothetical protein BDZ99DRAFT_463520 [Mytilinidion resinicola]